jgi:hypothetical protein
MPTPITMDDGSVVNHYAVIAIVLNGDANASTPYVINQSGGVAYPDAVSTTPLALRDTNGAKITGAAGLRSNGFGVVQFLSPQLDPPYVKWPAIDVRIPVQSIELSGLLSTLITAQAAVTAAVPIAQQAATDASSALSQVQAGTGIGTALIDDGDALPAVTKPTLVVAKTTTNGTASYHLSALVYPDGTSQLLAGSTVASSVDLTPYSTTTQVESLVETELAAAKVPQLASIAPVASPAATAVTADTGVIPAGTDVAVQTLSAPAKLALAYQYVPHDGHVLTTRHVQDATGGRAVPLGAGFTTNPDRPWTPGTDPGVVTTAEWTYEAAPRAAYVLTGLTRSDGKSGNLAAITITNPADFKVGDEAFRIEMLVERVLEHLDLTIYRAPPVGADAILSVSRFNHADGTTTPLGTMTFAQMTGIRQTLPAGAATGVPAGTAGLVCSCKQRDVLIGKWLQVGSSSPGTGIMGGFTDASAPVLGSITAPAAPTSLYAIVEESDARLLWTPPAGRADSYDVYRDTGAGRVLVAPATALPTSGAPFLDLDYDPKVATTFAVRTGHSDGRSAETTLTLPQYLFVESADDDLDPTRWSLTPSPLPTGASVAHAVVSTESAASASSPARPGPTRPQTACT